MAHSLRAQAQASFRADTDTYVPVKWPAEVAPALDTTMKKYMGLDNQHINGGGDGLLPEVANPLTARMHKGVNTTCDEGQTMIPMNGGGFDVAHAIRTAHTLDQAQGQAIAFKANMSVPSVGVGVAETLQAMNPGAVAFDLAQITSKTNRTRVEEGLPASTLNSAGQMHTASSMQVRRLTPMECERLQGFPDGYTLIPVGNKMSADGPRYKALGNSMAVPVMHWIGRRIAFVSKLEGGGK